MSWKTTDNLALLKHLASQGKSSEFIAWQMGENCTRNAVIGHCRRHRIPLTGKRGGKKDTKSKILVPKPEKKLNNNHWFAKRIPEKRKPPLEDSTLSDPKWVCENPVSLMDVLKHQCRWPAPGLKCCGKVIVYGSYCLKHADIAIIGRSKSLIHSEA